MTHIRPTEETLVTRGYGGKGKGLSLSKAVLGTFVYHLLRLGGRIEGTWAMGPQYDRSFVQMSIVLPKGRRDELETASGIALETPPTLRLA